MITVPAGARAAIYARFSNDRTQKAKSVDDQVAQCRERAAREGWQVVDVFADYGISGTIFARPMLEQLLARAGEFDVLLCDEVSRISRDLGDSDRIFKQLRFADCAWISLAEGPVTPMVLGFKGTMAAEELTAMAHRIRRGQRGRVAAGRSPGPPSYGYSVVRAFRSDGEVDRGIREINVEEAEVVRRIFDEFILGASPLAIATRLNEDDIASPTGREWMAAMVRVVLRNDIYRGVMIYGRRKMVRDPFTRRRVARDVPAEQWDRQDVPHMRIVSDEQWNAVQARLASTAHLAFNRQKRPRRLLSGLVSCGCCGGNYVIISANLWGCTTNRQKGTCTNGRRITTEQLEARVLDGLKNHLLDPELVRLAIKRAHEIGAADEKERARAKSRLDRKLGDIQVKVDRLVNAIANGADIDEVKSALAAAKADRAAAEREIAELGAENVVRLMPNLADTYQQLVSDLIETLTGTTEGQLKGVPALRSLIDSIRLYPRSEGRGVDIELTGRLANIIALTTGQPLAVEEAIAPTVQNKALKRYALKSMVAKVIV